MNKRKLNILYLGYSGFPYGFAEFQRLLLLSKALVENGASVKVLGSRATHYRKIHPDIKKVGHFQGLIYIYSSFSPFRSENFFRRNLSKPLEKVLEFITIIQLNKKRKIDAAIISTLNFRHLLIYKIISILLGFKIILNYVELRSSIISRRKRIITRFNDYCFDHFAVKLSDAVFPISEYLIKVMKKTSIRKPYLKIPVLVDLNRYQGVDELIISKYFLFCGAASYKEIIFFIIDAFELIKDENTQLYLIISGRDQNMSLITSRISRSHKEELIKIFTNINDMELSALYKNAIGLLIPLRPTLQDQARFPHKIGEYLASGNPVLTTDYGEIRHYLRNRVNAFISDHYDAQEYSELMLYVINNPSKSKSIAHQGKLLASKYFDYQLYGSKVINFISGL